MPRKIGPAAAAAKRFPFDRIAKTLEIASYVGGLLSLLLILLQLNSDASDRRISKALDMVERFSTEPISDYREMLLRAWLSRRDDLQTISEMGGITSDDAAVLVSSVLDDQERANPQDHVYVAVHELADYFDQLALCVDRGICDEAVVRSYFSAYAGEFTCLYGAIIADQARLLGTPALGRGLQQLRGRGDCG